MFNMNDMYFKEILREKLDDYRYQHSLCVADEAVRLAIKYGADKDAAYLAGLLHDITKKASREEHLKIFGDFDIILTDVEKSSDKLWHAMSGALYVKNNLKIENDEIISAIRYHTTAKKNMTLLEKVLYLADFTSAYRTYDDVEVMRRLVDLNMEDAMAYSLKYTITELTGYGSAIHPDTLEAYNEVILAIKNRGEK